GERVGRRPHGERAGRTAQRSGRFRRCARHARAERARPHIVVKLAFIIQRYGAEVLGGSEHLCRLVAERLAASHEVDVLTSCARDYVTWANVYGEGSDRVRGVTVRRVATSGARQIDPVKPSSAWL